MGKKGWWCYRINGTGFFINFMVDHTIRPKRFTCRQEAVHGPSRQRKTLPCFNTVILRISLSFVLGPLLGRRFLGLFSNNFRMWVPDTDVQE